MLSKHHEYIIILLGYIILYYTCRRLSSTVIDGRLLSDQLLAEIRDNVQSWVDAGNRKPRLVAILVGNDVASHTYVRNKMIAAEKTGELLIIQCFYYNA